MLAYLDRNGSLDGFFSGALLSVWFWCVCVATVRHNITLLGPVSSFFLFVALLCLSPLCLPFPVLSSTLVL